MTTITLRSVKGTPLTNNEVDANFSNLNTAKVETITSLDGSVSVTGTGDTRDLSVPINPNAVSGPASATDNAITRFDGTTGKLVQNSTVTLDDNGNVTNANAVTFDTTPATLPTTPGTLFWDSADGNQTLSLIMANGDATLQIGQEQYFRVKASSAITNGQVVMFSGTVGASGALTGAPATGLTAATASYIMGIATQDIPLNGWGYVTNFGLVRGLNTSAYTDGAILYYDPATPGGLTTSIPTAPNAKVQVCAVIHAASNGSLFVRPSFGGVLGQYEGDVNIASPLNGQVLTYNSIAGRWENQSIDALPPQTGHAGQFLSTDGSTASWNTVDALPSQTGNSGKYLTTDGSTASWEALTGGTVLTNTVFTATAGQTIFSVTYTPGLVEVFRNGVCLIPGADYAASTGTTVVLASAAAAGDSILVVAFNPINVYANIATDYFSGDGSTTAFAMSVSPADSAAALVTISGVVQDPASYTVTGSTITFSAAPPSGTNNITTRCLGVPSLSSVASFSGGTTGLTPATATTGAVTLAGTLGIANGGTGLTSVGTSGQVLSSNGTAMTWSDASSNKTALGLYENNATISADYTITSGYNAMSAGPITVNSGVTVTVPSGSNWVIL